MRSIAITTTQNVTIEYELAALGDRILAFVLDQLLIIAVIIAMVLIITSAADEDNMEFILKLFIIPFYFFYHLVCEILMNGQSPGKKAMAIRVVKLTGKQPSLSDYFIRWAFRLIDILLSVGAVASVLISSTDKSQRLGDMLANTVVVRMRPRNSVFIADILRIHSVGSYKPVYDRVKIFSDEEMLLIKTALERYKQYPNQAHVDVVMTLAERVRTALGVSDSNIAADVFLQTVLKDYIVLTR